MKTISISKTVMAQFIQQQHNTIMIGYALLAVALTILAVVVCRVIANRDSATTIRERFTFGDGLTLLIAGIVLAIAIACFASAYFALQSPELSLLQSIARH